MARIELPLPGNIVTPPPLTPVVRNAPTRVELPLPTVPVAADRIGRESPREVSVEIPKLPKTFLSSQERQLEQQAIAQYPVPNTARQRESEQLMYESNWENALTKVPEPIKTAQERFTIQRATWAPTEPEIVQEAPQNQSKGPSRNFPPIASLFAPDDSPHMTFKGINNSDKVDSKYLIVLTVSLHNYDLTSVSLRGYYEGSQLTEMDHRNKVHEAVLNEMPWEGWSISNECRKESKLTYVSSDSLKVVEVLELRVGMDKIIL